MIATQTALDTNKLLPDSLPDDWHVAYLADVAEIRTGLAKGKTNLKDSVELPYIRVANVQDGYFDLSQIKTIKVDRRDITRYSLQCGDVLITEGGDADKLGRGHIWHSQIEPCLHQNHIFVVRVRTEIMLAKFFAYYLGNSHGRLYFLKCAKQTTNLASINSSQLRKMPLPIPPLEEQARIVEILDAADAVVRAAETLIDAKLRHKHALAEQLLLPNRSRFPEFAGQAWREYTLGELFTERIECNRPDLKLLAVTGTEGVVDRDSLAKRDTSSEDKSKYLRVAPGDIVYNTMRMWQGVFGLSPLDGIVSPAYTVCIPNVNINALFAAYLFKTPATIAQFRRYSQGLVDDTLSCKFLAFSRVKVTIPALPEQQRIAETLQLVDEEINLLRRQLDCHKQIKHGLMEQLLLGRIRVREATP